MNAKIADAIALTELYRDCAGCLKMFDEAMKCLSERDSDAHTFDMFGWFGWYAGIVPDEYMSNYESEGFDAPIEKPAPKPMTRAQLMRKFAR